MAQPRWPLFTYETNDLDKELFALLTDAQLAWLARRSVEQSLPVITLLRRFNPMVEDNGDGQSINLLGTLPHCNLYGCLLPDGTAHT